MVANPSHRYGAIDRFIADLTTLLLSPQGAPKAEGGSAAPPAKRARTESSAFRIHGPRYFEFGRHGEHAACITRIACSEAVAHVCRRVQSSQVGADLLSRELGACCARHSANSRMICGLICWFWWQDHATHAPAQGAAAAPPVPSLTPLQREIYDRMLQHLSAGSPCAPSPPSPLPYDELQPYCTRLHREFDALVTQVIAGSRFCASRAMEFA